MTRQSPVLILVALALGACAPAARQAAAPVPTPAATPAPPPPAAPAAETPEIRTASNDWWLLDPATDGTPGIGADRVYDQLLVGTAPRDTIIVAVIDGGVDISHPDLDDHIWTNPGEIAGNNEDDDGNGYVDDVHGWDFIGGATGDVDQDTYEVTRLYAALSEACAGSRPTDDRCARYPEIKDAFEKQRAETADYLDQLTNIQSAMQRFTTLLRTELGTDSLTLDRVAALNTTRPELLRAKSAWIQLVSQGATLEEIGKERQRVEDRLRYSLNPEFNPRPIVGDDYSDLSQRVYGNNDVHGPDPLHGTHVSGIIGAERGNGLGINGVAVGVRIMPVRAVPDGDERDKDVANAIRYAVDNGARVINMSFGKGYSPQKRAVDAAVKYADAHGVLMVHAAGNDGANNDTTDNFPTRRYLDGGEATNWIEVGASSWRGVDSLAAPFSNYGHTSVDVFAPGVDIYSTIPDNQYEKNSGTSMASPVVAGVAALILSYHPELTAAQVKQIIMDSATRYPGQTVAKPGGDGTVRFSDLSVSGGVVDAYRALELARQRTAAVN